MPATTHHSAVQATRLVLLVLTLLLVGCGSLQRAVGPEPLALSDAASQALASAADDAALAKVFDDPAATETQRKFARDRYVVARVALLDLRFLRYLRSLSVNRRSLDAATDATVLGLSVLGTVRDTVNTQQNLAALVALVTGLKANVDKNYYDDRGLDALISTMVARRKEVLARIVQALPGDTTGYGVLAARADLDDYWLAGTMDGAFAAIQSEATRRDSAASKTLGDLRLVRNTVENLEAATLDGKRALTRALNPQTASLDKLQRALTNLQVPPDQIPATVEPAARLLQDIVRAAVTTAKIDAITAAFREAGLLGP